MHPYRFGFEPLFLALCAVAAVAYIRASATVSLGFERRRAWLFGLGLALVAGALDSPLETLARDYLLLVHLLQNVMIADWAPPLLLLGLTPAARAAIVRRGGRVLARASSPKLAVPFWLLVWYAVHLAAFYDFALRNQWFLNVEHALLILAGLVFWWPVLAPEQESLSTAGAIAYLAVGFVGSAFLGLALMFSTTPFYDYYEHVPRIWGLSPARDQNLGGLVMNAEETVVFLAAIAYFLMRLLGEEEESQRAAEGS